MIYDDWYDDELYENDWDEEDDAIASGSMDEFLG